MFFEITIILIGLAIGLLVGISSTGVGLLGTPALIFLAGLSPAAAISVELLQAAIMKTVGVYNHVRKKTVVYPIVFDFLILGIPGAFIGSNISLLIPVRTLEIALGVVLPIAAIILLYETWIGKSDACCDRCYYSDGFKFSLRTKLLVILLGGFIGFVSGLTSIGSGILLILALLVIHRVPIPCALGTSLFAGFLIVATGALSHLSLGNVDLGLVGLLIIGSVPGIYIGTKLAFRVPVKLVRSLVALIAMLAGTNLIFKFI